MCKRLLNFLTFFLTWTFVFLNNLNLIFWLLLFSVETFHVLNLSNSSENVFQIFLRFIKMSLDLSDHKLLIVLHWSEIVFWITAQYLELRWKRLPEFLIILNISKSVFFFFFFELMWKVFLILLSLFFLALANMVCVHCVHNFSDVNSIKQT